MQQFIADAWSESGRAEMGAFAAWVAFVAAALAGTCGLALWWNWSFSFSNPHDIRGWAWAHQYPKQQEIAAYAIAVTSVAGGAFASRIVWCGMAAIIGSSRLCTTESALRASALASTLLLPLIPLIAGEAWGELTAIRLPLAGAAALALTSGLAISVPPPQHRPTGATATVLRFVIIPVLLYGYAYETAPIGYPPHLFEEGASLAPLQSALAGGVAYGDSYLQHGLLQNLGKPLLGARIDPSLIGFREVNVWLAPLGCVALYLLGLAVFRWTGTAVLLGLIAGYQTIPISDRQAFGFLAVAALAFALGREAETARRRLVLASGASTTVAFFYSTEIGLFAAAACGAFLSLRLLFAAAKERSAHLADLGRYVAGSAATAVPWLVYFAARGVFYEFADNVAIQLTYQTAVWGLPFPALGDYTREFKGWLRFASSRGFSAYFPAAIYATSAAVVAYRMTRPGFWQSRRGPTLLLITLAAVVWFRSTLGRFDPFHLEAGIPLLWILLLIFIENVMRTTCQGFRNEKNRARNVVAAIAGAALLVAGAWSVDRAYLVKHRLSRRLARVATAANFSLSLPVARDRFGGLDDTVPMVAELRALVGRIQALSEPDDFIYDLTNQGALYFLADRRVPSRFQQLIYACTRELEREVIADLERNQPALVVYSSSGPIATYLSELDGVASSIRNPEITAWVQRHYRYAEEVGGTTLYLRNEL